MIQVRDSVNKNLCYINQLAYSNVTLGSIVIMKHEWSNVRFDCFINFTTYLSLSTICRCVYYID